MHLVAAEEKDFDEVVALANFVYRNLKQGTGWNTEAGIIDGERLNRTMLREDLASKPGSVLLIAREEESRGALMGTVWLEPKDAATWYLGLLTVRMDLQGQSLGRAFLEAGEAYAREHGATAIRMTVLNIREALVAWYERRGYRKTGEAVAFPYGDERFGRPLREDLEFLVLEKML